MTLRRRVFRYVVGTALAACVLTVGVAVVLVRARVSAQRMSALEHEAEVVAAIGGAPGALLAGEHVYRIGAGRPRRLRPVVARLVLDQVHEPIHSQGTIDVAGRSVLYAARSTPQGGIVLVRSAALAFGEWRPFLGSLLLAGLGGAVLAGASSYLLARRLVRPIAELSAATERVARGEPGVVVTAGGADELAELGRSFNLMSTGLARARDEQRSFLESVSHELKTPLTSIRGYAEGLSEGAIAPEQAGSVITSEAGRLERLVSDLLDLARLTRAGFSVQSLPVDLSDVAARSVERHLPGARGLSVSLTVESHGPAPGVGDPDRLIQATSNLIENALRLTPARGAVTVRAGPGWISVADTGPGLAPEDLPRAFERFYLYERYRSERPVGSGLGLAIVHELAASMGGSIAVENVPGGGARFTLRVPRAPAPGAGPTPT